jgi:hypothetical protein
MTFDKMCEQCGKRFLKPVNFRRHSMTCGNQRFDGRGFHFGIDLKNVKKDLTSTQEKL